MLLGVCYVALRVGGSIVYLGALQQMFSFTFLPFSGLVVES